MCASGSNLCGIPAETIQAVVSYWATMSKLAEKHGIDCHEAQEELRELKEKYRMHHEEAERLTAEILECRKLLEAESRDSVVIAEKYFALSEAVDALRKAKGRHNTQIAFENLMKL